VALASQECYTFPVMDIRHARLLQAIIDQFI